MDVKDYELCFATLGSCYEMSGLDTLRYESLHCAGRLTGFYRYTTMLRVSSMGRDNAFVFL
jgi:hypothetical protein